MHCRRKQQPHKHPHHMYYHYKQQSHTCYRRNHQKDN